MAATNFDTIKTILLTLLLNIFAVGIVYAQTSNNDAPIFIVIGQSNADGSAMFDGVLDKAMHDWYASPANPGKMKIWYRSSQVQNQISNNLGEEARWVVDGTVTDVAPGWLNLWYRNENTLGRTAMNMIHGFGTYSAGSGTNCAQGRRGMEGAFGQAFQKAFPTSDLYVLKLGASGSFISSWANPADDHNWNYFYNRIFKPAITDLLAKGKRPRLAGVWWMQGCADREADKAYYAACLNRLVDRIENELGFNNGKVYIGHIVKPGESTVTPTGSVQYGQGVRDAQDEVAAKRRNVEIVDTKNFPMQYEPSFGGYVHFSHAGVNAIGEELARRVINTERNGWIPFSTPGKWVESGGIYNFVPSFGTPKISYTYSNDELIAILTYPGFTEMRRRKL